MGSAIKILVPVAVGGAVAFGVWYFTRSDTPPPAVDSSVSGIRQLQGYTQGRGYSQSNILKPLASAGLQQLIFNRRRSAY